MIIAPAERASDKFIRSLGSRRLQSAPPRLESPGPRVQLTNFWPKIEFCQKLRGFFRGQTSQTLPAPSLAKGEIIRESPPLPKGDSGGFKNRPSVGIFGKGYAFGSRWLLCLLLLWSAGCISFHLPSAAPPVYYQLEYPPPAVRCTHSFQQGMRVWKFNASSPYGRTEMAVVKPGGQVSFSNNFQWVASPGTLVADSLVRDLAASRLFPQTVGANDPATVPLELSGRVFVFAWDRSGGASRADFQVEVSLVNTDSSKVLLRREYHFKSEPMAEDTSASFAQAMSGLVAEFSRKIQEDLCASLAGGH
jgi:ABC-type uncharacterized transport system auxiliary subunit